MKYTKLGKTGITVSKICLGTMTFGYTIDEKKSNALIQRALELGINFFDTANVYGRGRSEEILGTAIKTNWKAPSSDFKPITSISTTHTAMMRVFQPRIS